MDAVRIEPGWSPALRPAALAAARRKAESAQATREMTARVEALGPYELGIGFARLGDSQAALHWLEEALRRHVADLPSIRWDPAVDRLRCEVRFRAIVDAIYGAGATGDGTAAR